MSGTTADKLNYLKDTKELLRQELNNDFSDLNLTASDPFRQYPSRISSSQLWMDAWIGGSVELDATYDGTGSPVEFRNRYFNTLSMPNVTETLYSIIANTVILGGPTSAKDNLVTSATNNIRNLYVNNLTSIFIASAFAFAVISDTSNLYLPSLTSIGGSKGTFNRPIYALLDNLDIYLPKITQLKAWSIRGGNLHIGDTNCSLDTRALESISNIYVPASLVDSYKSATNWSSYANSIFAEPGT